MTNGLLKEPPRPGRLYATLAILALILIAVIATPFALFMWLLAKLGGWV